MFLETGRLVLRRFREEDFGDFFQYAADREMSRMMGRDDRPERRGDPHGGKCPLAGLSRKTAFAKEPWVWYNTIR